jgi:hypothetical protein
VLRCTNVGRRPSHLFVARREEQWAPIRSRNGSYTSSEPHGRGRLHGSVCHRPRVPPATSRADHGRQERTSDADLASAFASLHTFLAETDEHRAQLELVEFHEITVSQALAKLYPASGPSAEHGRAGQGIEKAFDFAQGATKQLITLATGVIALTITFLTDAIETAPECSVGFPSDRLGPLSRIDRLRDPDAARAHGYFGTPGRGQSSIGLSGDIVLCSIGQVLAFTVAVSLTPGVRVQGGLIASSRFVGRQLTLFARAEYGRGVPSCGGR